jgi:hypothetical protein
MDEADALEDLVDLYAEEGMDELVPAIAGLAARTALRPALRRAASALPPAAARRAVRATSGVVRRMVARGGPAAARAVAPIARSVARVTARRRLPPRAAAAALQRATARVAAQPRLARRLAAGPSPATEPRRRAVGALGGVVGRRFVIQGPVEIRIIGR